MIIRQAGVLFVALSVVAGTAAAQDRADITIDQDGKRLELRHVAAVRYTPASGEKEIRLLFTSADPAGVVLADPFGRDDISRWSQKAGAPVVSIVFPEESPEQYQFSYHNVAGRSGSGGGTASGGETRGVFKDVEVAGDRVSGTLLFTMNDMPVSGAFSVRMGAVDEAAAVTGAPVRKSAQAQVLIAFARALSKQDLTAAQALAVGDLAGDLENLKKMLGPDAVKEVVKERFGDVPSLERRLGSAEASLRESGDAAVITLTRRVKDKYGEGTERTTFRFVREGGNWKISM